MIQDQVKKELDQRGWSILKLSQETGIRYPSLTEWFKDKKGLDSTNLEKIFTKLELKIAKKMNASYKEKIDKFIENVKNGKPCYDLVFQTPSTTYRWKNEQKDVVLFNGNQVDLQHPYDVVEEIERFIVGE